MTKRMIINAMVSYFEGVNENEVLYNSINVSDGIKYLKHELELLDNKSSNRKPTKKQKENEELKGVILDTLVKYPDGITVTELQEANQAIGKDKFSNQKISSLLSQLKEAKLINKTTDEKKRSIFSIV